MVKGDNFGVPRSLVNDRRPCCRVSTRAFSGFDSGFD